MVDLVLKILRLRKCQSIHRIHWHKWNNIGGAVNIPNTLSVTQLTEPLLYNSIVYSSRSKVVPIIYSIWAFLNKSFRQKNKNKSQTHTHNNVIMSFCLCRISICDICNFSAGQYRFAPINWLKFLNVSICGIQYLNVNIYIISVEVD